MPLVAEKKSTARVRLIKNGTGKITVNEKSYDAYFPSFEFKNIITQPLEVVGKLKDFDFSIKVAGGGETEKAINLLKISDKFNWISVGGGAFLEFLVNKTLPGIKAFDN